LYQAARKADSTTAGIRLSICAGLKRAFPDCA
jgi:hypothetical protein